MAVMGKDAAPVTEMPGYLLYKAGMFGQRMFDDAVGSVGMSAREFLAVSFIGGAVLSQQDLARRMGLDPTLIVSLVDELERRGVVDRTRDPADRRRNVLSLTTEGKRLLRKAQRTASEAEAEFLAPLDEAQRCQLAALLVALMTPKLPWLQARSTAD